MWLYKGKEFLSEMIEDNFGFIYIITDLENSKKYIGKKNFYSVRKVKGKTRRQRKESDWKKYYSSSKIIKEIVKECGTSRFKREILLLCKSQGELNYSENKYLFMNEVLESEDWYNDNILGRYFSVNVKKYDSSKYNKEKKC